MVLRPWNVFRKTIYAGGVGIGGAAAQLPITARISLARARLKAGDVGTVGAGATMVYRLSILVPPSLVAWLLLGLAHWRYSDAERLSELEKAPGGAILLDILGSRIAAHVGPYQIPNFVRSAVTEEPLVQLRDPLLLDHERSRALTRLEQATHRRQAAQVLAYRLAGQEQPLLAVEPLLKDMFEAASHASSVPNDRAVSHKAIYLRLVLDVVVAIPEEKREVPLWVLEGLVSAQGSPWDDSAQGEELRVTLLFLLLACPKNCIHAAGSQKVCDYVETPGMKRKEDTFWPLKAYLLSGETPDLLRRCARLINKQCPDSVLVPPKYKRDTPSLQIKHDFRSLWTTVLISAGWATVRTWRGVFDANAVFAMATACGGALAGMGLLEAVWRAEERVIESVDYFNNSQYMLLSSAGMCAAHCIAWAWAFQYHVLPPFLFCRLMKDGLMDSHRSFEL